MKRTALITGAGSGIGRAIAVKLTQEGIYVILVGRNEERLKNTLEICQEGMAECFAADLRNEDEVKNLYKQLDQVDYLINNAGMALNKSLEETSLEEFEMVMDTNLKSTFLMCKYGLSHLRKSEVPTIINMGSVVAHVGYAGQSIYGASKHAVYGMSKALSKELYQEGIRVHVINPGGVLTDMIRKARPDLPVDEDDMILPSDIADIVYFMLSHRNNAVIDEINVHRRTKEPFL